MKQPRSAKRRYVCALLLIVSLIVPLSLAACQRGSEVPLSPGLSLIEGVAVHDKDVAVRSDHFTVTPGMMGYFFYTYGLRVLEEIQQTLPYDAGKLLHDQMYDETRSYYDMIMNEALDRVCKMLICCEAARAEGVELTAEQEEEISKLISADRVKAAGEYGLQYDAYLKQMYGPQMTSADMEEILALETLANSFSRTLNTRLEEGVTKEQINAYLAAQESVDHTPSRNISFLFIPFVGGGVNTERVNKACEAMQKTPGLETLESLSDLGTLGEEANMTPKNSGIKAITAWLFDSARRVGEWGRVDVEGATYILLYTGNGIGYDEVHARMTLYDNAYAAWYNSWVEA